MNAIGLPELIGVIGIVVSIGLYFAGVRHGRRQERQRQEHERSIEEDRRIRDLQSKFTDEFVRLVRRHIDGGPHALATLGLDQLGNDKAIREAIQEMYVRSGQKPWGDEAKHVEDIDLVAFFQHVREKRVDFFRTTVATVADDLRKLGYTK